MNAKILAILPNRLDLLVRNRIEDRQTAIGRRHIVVDDRIGAIGPAHFSPGQPQALERLGAGHFVDQLEIDIKDGLFPRFLKNDVIVPDFLEHRAGLIRLIHGRGILAGGQS